MIVFRRFALPAIIAAILAGCGGADQRGELTSHQLSRIADDLTTENGMSTNGMSTNGMSTNGMYGNGLALSGPNNSLSTQGLTNSTMKQPAFIAWFQLNTSYANMVMAYVVRCAVPSGQTRTYTYGTKSYSWQGVLGLAPVWSSGSSVSTIEQQLVSACMGAHVNRFGMHVDFSIVGFRGDQTLLGYEVGEHAAYPIQEGAFYGNMFTGGQVWSCSSSITDHPGISGPRECAMMDMPANVCAPLINTQADCSADCFSYNIPGLGNAYSRCQGPDGNWYPAMTTALSTDEVYNCGDGTCQFTESCFDPSTRTGCLADCGRCN